MYSITVNIIEGHCLLDCTDETYKINVFSASAFIAPLSSYFATTASLLLKEHYHLSTRERVFTERLFPQNISAPTPMIMLR